MELPPFNHQHHNRYVPHPITPLNFIDDHRNFYPHHHLLPPPSYLPVPSPISPPPPYNPHQSQITFFQPPHHHPIEEDPIRLQLFDSPRVSDRPLFENDQPRLWMPEFNNLRPDYWADPPRVPSDHRPIGPLPSLDREQPHHHRPFIDHRRLKTPYRPSGNYQFEVDRSSRFRDEFIDGFRDNNIQNQETLWGQNRVDETVDVYGRDNLISNSDVSSRNFRCIIDSDNDSNHDLSRDFLSNLGNLESCGGSVSDNERSCHNRDANRRWGDPGQPLGDVFDSALRMKSNELDKGNGIARRVPQIYNSVKFNNRGRESREEFCYTPRKQQRKSALLRIQVGKPSNRNRSLDHHFSIAHSDDSNTSTSRGKDKDTHVHSDRRLEVEREGSPVQLDVSFKSNALVAKAIMAPSNPVADSNRTLTPRNRKIRKVTLSDSPATKFNWGSVKSDSHTHGLDCPSVTNKEPKQLTGKVKVSGNESECDIDSQPCSSRTIELARSNIHVESPERLVADQNGNTVGSGGTPLIRVRKNKVTRPFSLWLSSQSMKKDGEPVNKDGSKISPSTALLDDGVLLSKDKFTSTSMDMVPNAVKLLSPTGETVEEVGKSLQAMVLEKDCTDIASDEPSVHTTKRKQSSLSSFLVSSSTLDTENGGNNHADRSLHDLNSIPVSGKDLIELQNRSTVSGIVRVDDVGQDTCLNGVSLVIENGHVKGSSEHMVLVSGDVCDDNAGLPSSEEVEIHEGPADKHASVHGVHNSSDSDCGFIEVKENTTLLDADSMDAGTKQSFFNQVAALLKNGIMEGSPNTVFTVGESGNIDSSIAQERKIYEGITYTCYSNQESSFTSSSNGGFTSSSIKRSCLDEATILLDNGPTEGSPKAKVLMRGNPDICSGKNNPPKVTRKRKVRNTRLILSSPSHITSNAVTSGHDIDTTFRSPVKYFLSAEDQVTGSAAGSFHVGSQPYKDGDNILHCHSLNEQSSDVDVSDRGGDNVGLSETSPKYDKKRKPSAQGLSFSTLSEIHEGPVSTDTSTTSAEVLFSINKDVTQSKDRTAVFSIDTVYPTGLPPCSKPKSELLENRVEGGYFEVELVGDGFMGDCSKHEQESPYLSKWQADEKEHTTLVTATINHLNGNIDVESRSRAEYAAEHAVQVHSSRETETTQYGPPLEMQIPNSDQRVSTADAECENYQLLKEDLPSASNNLSLSVDEDVSAINSGDEMMDSVADTVSNAVSSENFSILSGSNLLNINSSFSQVPKETSSLDDKRLHENHASKGGSVLSSPNKSLKTSNIKVKSGIAMVSDVSMNSMPASFISKVTNRINQRLNPLRVESSLRRNQQNSAVTRRVFPGSLPLAFTTSRKSAFISHIAKPRTWHRMGNPSSAPMPGTKSYSIPVPSQRQLSKEVGKVQSSSYIRKGNSLVRKPSPVNALHHGSHAPNSSVYRLNPSDIDVTDKRKGPEIRVDVNGPKSCSSTGGYNAPSDRSQTPPLPNNTKSLNYTTLYSGDSRCSPLVDPPSNACSAATSYFLDFTVNMDLPKSSEDAIKSSGGPDYHTDPSNNLENQSAQDEGNLVKKIVYIKRKSNQLVASSNQSDQDLDKTQALLPADGYYKRRKNQLIRSSMEGEVKQRVDVLDVNLNSEGKRASLILNRSSCKRQSAKGLAKTYKPSKFSLVWTLCGTQSSVKDSNLLRCRKVWPQLFPWKRATHWRGFMHNPASLSNNSSISTISRKLLLSRKRDTVYTRSNHGFSLRKSKVLSVGGTSLKWSKSIERNSKKANEEATLAVAAVEQRKREQNGAACTIDGENSRYHTSRKSVHSTKLSPGERIFRVGLVRYKMDPTKRTLQRISDGDPSCLAAPKSDKDSKKSYVPRRLVIGNDEYVRIGNGNQLIRDPKKRTRILASEKVRWSLHTARLRLARKRKYCQFFTRFGKCNKDDGKCPYVHDPSKIAVCTKFLNGSCSNPNCKLTHKVIPERMQDCSYFLQGLCSNEHCPYRHVNVNPNSSICEGFLRGYCADGNECRKKHTYVCAIFEATGICPQGSKCKLHHPRNQKRGLKRKPSDVQKNTRGRYFGSRHIDIAECKSAVSENHSAKEDHDIFLHGGNFVDYISLGDDIAGQTDDPTCEQTTLCDSEPSDIQVADPDELTKPIRIMNKHTRIESSPAIDSPSEMTASCLRGI